MPEFYLQDAYNTLTQYMENPFSTDLWHFQNMAIRISEIADKLTSEELKKLHTLGERNSSRKTHYKELVQPIFRDLLQLKTD
jgi:hypothetical protein